MPATLAEWLRSAVGAGYEEPVVRHADVTYANGKAGAAVTFAYSRIYPK